MKLSFDETGIGSGIEDHTGGGIDSLELSHAEGG